MTKTTAQVFDRALDLFFDEIGNAEITAQEYRECLQRCIVEIQTEIAVSIENENG